VSDRLHDLAHLHGIFRRNFLRSERELVRLKSWSVPETHRPKLLQHACLLFRGMPASQHTIKHGGQSFLSTGKSRPLRIGEETTRTEFFGTFITEVWIRVIYSAIFVLVATETVPS
jgi:hypothetical protein